ncbi:PEP-CTERM sorting domain-containing protein [Kiritimatiellaeota bacterium B1221]|nr:PEP-CTERM sorting domain-containing protein [Kiritimatiellaeota bacterium B1221]
MNITQTTSSFIRSSLLAVCFSASFSSAAIVESNLSGSTSLNGWEGLNNSYYSPANHGGGYPGTAPWGSAMTANEGEADAQLMKISGSAYPGGSSLYTSAGAVLSVSEVSPLADLETILFSISVGAGPMGDFVSGPSLTLNGASVIGAATTSWDFGSSTESIGGFDVSQTSYSYQWDLSGFGSAITDFDIQFETHEHAQLYAIQLDQSDSYSLATPHAIPEPSTMVLFSIACGAVFYSQRFYKKRK